MNTKDFSFLKRIAYFNDALFVDCPNLINHDPILVLLDFNFHPRPDFCCPAAADIGTGDNWGQSLGGGSKLELLGMQASTEDDIK